MTESEVLVLAYAIAKRIGKKYRSVDRALDAAVNLRLSGHEKYTKKQIASYIASRVKKELFRKRRHYSIDDIEILVMDGTPDWELLEDFDLGEYDVVVLRMEGHTYQEICSKLSVSNKTLTSIRQSIKRKLEHGPKAVGPKKQRPLGTKKPQTLDHGPKKTEKDS